MIRFSFSIEIELGRSPTDDPSTTFESLTRLKRLVKKRDEQICQYCGKPAPDGHIDHVTPLSRGGTDSIDNLKWACAACNMSKGDRMLDEWPGMNIFRQQQATNITLEIVRPEEKETDTLSLYGINADVFQAFAKAVLDGTAMTTHAWVGPSGLFSQGQFSSLMAKLEQLDYVRPGRGNYPRELTSLGMAFFEELIMERGNHDRHGN